MSGVASFVSVSRYGRTTLQEEKKWPLQSKETRQLAYRVLRDFFGEEMPSLDRLAPHITSPLLPYFQRSTRVLVPGIKRASFAPKDQNGALNLSPSLANDSVFAFAGLWESWYDPNGGVIESCTILTTKSNALVADVHNRMPAILKPDDYGAWLDPGIKNPAMVTGFLKSFDADVMKKYPVSTRVNSPVNDDNGCAQEVSIQVAQTVLF